VKVDERRKSQIENLKQKTDKFSLRSGVLVFFEQGKKKDERLTQLVHESRVSPSLLTAVIVLP